MYQTLFNIFTNVNSFSLHSNTMTLLLLLLSFTFLKMRKLTKTQSFSALPEGVTQLVSSRDRHFISRIFALCHYTVHIFQLWKEIESSETWWLEMGGKKHERLMWSWGFRTWIPLIEMRKSREGINFKFGMAEYFATVF